MDKQQLHLIKMSIWCSIILFVIRCAFSWNSLIKCVALYDLFSYAGEAIGVTAVLSALYEKWFWRFNPFEKTPKLLRSYSGILISQYDGIERKASLEIHQSLLSIHITLVTDESKSNSISASIDEVIGEPTLTYCYLNTPKSAYRDRSEIHFGTAVLSVRNPNHITGQYYTDRKTIGDMEFYSTNKENGNK